MKKTLLTIGLAALSTLTFAQTTTVKPGVNNVGVYDDFMDAIPGTAAIDEYSYQTNMTKWNDTLNAPDPTKKAFTGAFWTQATGTDLGFVATKNRSGNGVLKYTITQDTGRYVPFLVVFGAYAEATQKRYFTLDLSNDANVSFTFTNSGTKTIRLQVQLQDIDDTTLVYMAGATQPLFYNYNIGFTQGQTTAIAPGATVNFAYDFKDAIVGAQPGDRVLPNAQFDYSRVKGVLLTVVNDAAVDPANPVVTARDYRPIGIEAYPIEISNFKIGAVSTITSLEDEAGYVAANEIVSVYTLQGNFVATGKFNELSLEAGKPYIVKSSSKTRKIVIK